MIESIVQAHPLDGLVLLTNCDKITPGMLMAAGRLDLPASSSPPGRWSPAATPGAAWTWCTTPSRPWAAARPADLSEAEARELEMEACPGDGSCQGLYTANTMACLTEAMGMSLPGTATALAGTAKKQRIA